MQGVKRGIMEIADFIVVNKADGALKSTAVRTAADYAGALRLLRKREQDPAGVPDALIASATEGDGLREIWDRLAKLHEWRRDTDRLAARRAAQATGWMRFALDENLKAAFAANAGVAAALPDAERRVAEGEETPEAAAARLTAIFVGEA